ncbi:hypothetical protein EVAR_43241_1 [Eumeta japonica]|uniref:Uncharacterized protein n=1 Tax=Eumeta variegata TaxID=151549 RepID=A0A4C1WRU6_EUMVA|nr:hypothetical protein EVAR_43241_1 [Eumeta japonica]
MEWGTKSRGKTSTGIENEIKGTDYLVDKPPTRKGRKTSAGPTGICVRRERVSCAGVGPSSREGVATAVAIAASSFYMTNSRTNARRGDEAN